MYFMVSQELTNRFKLLIHLQLINRTTYSEIFFFLQASETYRMLDPLCYRVNVPFVFLITSLGVFNRSIPLVKATLLHP